MLQVEMLNYASDAIEDAMRLAQTKSLNSYSWSDMLNYLNYAWSDMYNRIAMIDDGYYSTTVRLNTIITHMPPFLKNTLRVYGAQDVVGFNRDIFRESGMNDMKSRSTYYLSGFDLYCPDAVRRTVWLSFVPIAPQIFFTKNNRDPRLLDEDPEVIENNDYHLYTVDRSDTEWVLRHKNPAITQTYPLGRMIDRTDEDLDIVYLSCDFPYIFVTYQHRYTGVYTSGFYRDIMKTVEFIEYNPFDYTGRMSNVRYLQCHYNDKTGMGVIVRDYDDYDERERRYRVKELGWTPDTLLQYPCPEMYRYLVARLADKFSALNESNVMGVAKELVEARYAFEAFCSRDKSAWKRIDNVNGPYLGDWL